jgi:hypothetical protein
MTSCARFTLPVSFLLVAPVIGAAADDKAGCELTERQREELLELPFAQFDQQEGSGWRPLYEVRCYTRAADLIADYMKRHSDLVERHPELANQVYILPAHAGQMYALAGRYDVAIDYLQSANQKTSQALIHWNAYMAATIAFLRRDRDDLLKQRELIARQPPMPKSPGVPEWMAGKKVDLDVVDRLIACFDKPFEAGFRDGCEAAQYPPAANGER